MLYEKLYLININKTIRNYKLAWNMQHGHKYLAY